MTPNVSASFVVSRTPSRSDLTRISADLAPRRWAPAELLVGVARPEQSVPVLLVRNIGLSLLLASVVTFGTWITFIGRGSWWYRQARKLEQRGMTESPDTLRTAASRQARIYGWIAIGCGALGAWLFVVGALALCPPIVGTHSCR
jgi:hypothetical protein